MCVHVRVWGDEGAGIPGHAHHCSASSVRMLSWSMGLILILGQRVKASVSPQTVAMGHVIRASPHPEPVSIQVRVGHCLLQEGGVPRNWLADTRLAGLAQRPFFAGAPRWPLWLAGWPPAGMMADRPW